MFSFSWILYSSFHVLKVHLVHAHTHMHSQTLTHTDIHTDAKRCWVVRAATRDNGGHATDNR